MKQKTDKACKVPMVLKMPNEMRNRLRAASTKAGVSMAALVRDGIEAMIAQHGVSARSRAKS